MADNCNLSREDEARVFFRLRFSKPCMEEDSYCREWKKRFRRGEPETHMDSESKNIWKFIQGACEKELSW